MALPITNRTAIKRAHVAVLNALGVIRIHPTLEGMLSKVSRQGQRRGASLFIRRAADLHRCRTDDSLDPVVPPSQIPIFTVMDQGFDRILSMKFIEDTDVVMSLK